MSKARILLRWANLLLILATLAAYSAPLFSPVNGWLPALFAVFFPWLLLANVLFVLGWALLRSRNAFFSLACILLGWGHVSSFLGLNGSVSAPAQSLSLRVGSLNVHNLVDWEQPDQWTKPERLLDLIRQSEADVFCFQEFASRKTREYVAVLREQSQLKYAFHQNGSLIVLSRFPIQNGREELFANRTNGFQEIDLQVGEQVVRLYNLHLQTNGISRDLEDWVAEQEEVESATYFGRLAYLFRQYWSGAKVRARQVEQVAALVESSPHPVIACGDFNDVPLSWTYRRMTRKLTDGFRQRGFGLGTTYSGLLPALRIDYILADPSMRVLSYQTAKAPFSDHKPVWSTLAMPAE